ncbi:hypothetical protein Tco_0814428 [Tanacetum coccineum]
MSDIPMDGSIWNLLNSGTTGAGSTSNSQFPGFSSQAPMTPEQQAFFESQQAAFVAFQQDFQNRQQNPPQFEMPQQQSQSSNSLSQTESQPKKGRMKRTAKKGKSSEPIGDVTLRWTSDEETLLAECFVAVSEDPIDFDTGFASFVLGDNPILSSMPPISSLPPLMVCGVSGRLVASLSLCGCFVL